MTRRMCLAVAGAGLLSAAKPRLSRTRVSAITDEMAATQSDAVRAAHDFGFEAVELRNVPETGKPFATLSDPELKRWATELSANKLRVSVLHLPASAPAGNVALLNPAAIWPANPDPAVVGTWTPHDDWQEAWRRLPRARISNVRVPASTLDRQSPTHINWKGILEMLQKDGYAGNLTIETGVPPSDVALESIRELIHLIGQVA